jgi:hypothetical protein
VKLRERRLFRVIASASEAIHRAATRKNGLLRRYAPRKDVDRSEYNFAFSRRDAPEVLLETSPSRNRGRGEDRVRAAPAVSRAMCIEECAHEHTGSAETLRPPPRNGFTAYFALAPVTGFLATVIS